MVLLIAKSGLGQVSPPPSNDPGHELSTINTHLVPEEARLAGLPAGSKPEALSWQRTLTLALIRARDAKPTRFDSLDPGPIDEKAKALGTDDFARFRADYVVAKAFTDPSADLLSLQSRLMVIQNARRSVAAIESLAKLIKELALGSPSGLGQGEIDLFEAPLSEARRGLAREIKAYRDGLDVLKVSLGLSAHAPVIIDVSPLAGFRNVFEATDRWFKAGDRNINDLASFAKRLPAIGDVSIEGNSILSPIDREPDRLEETLSLATRAALKNRRKGEDRDAIELQIRRRIRHLAEIDAEYEGERRASVVVLRQFDAATEQLISPPATGVNPGQSGQPVLKMVELTRKIAENRDRLVTLWTTFRAERLAFYRDMGLFPFENWSAFYDQFTARVTGPAVMPPAQPVKPVPQVKPVNE
jgi:hypothetical protein